MSSFGLHTPAPVLAVARMAAAALTWSTTTSGALAPALQPLLLSNGLRPRPPHHIHHYLNLKRPIPFCLPTRPICGSRRVVVFSGFLPVDPWAPGMVDSQSVASQLFALSLFPYLGFLYFITKSNSAPKLTLFGFYFLLVFVGLTIPAGIYAKLHYGTSLSNVDWLHGGAESLLTLTNLFIVLGMRMALRKDSKDTDEVILDAEEKEKSSV